MLEYIKLKVFGNPKFLDRFLTKEEILSEYGKEYKELYILFPQSIELGFVKYFKDKFNIDLNFHEVLEKYIDCLIVNETYNLASPKFKLKFRFVFVSGILEELYNYIHRSQYNNKYNVWANKLIKFSSVYWEKGLYRKRYNSSEVGKEYTHNMIGSLYYLLKYYKEKNSIYDKGIPSGFLSLLTLDSKYFTADTLLPYQSQIMYLNSITTCREILTILNHIVEDEDIEDNIYIVKYQDYVTYLLKYTPYTNGNYSDVFNNVTSYYINKNNTSSKSFISDVAETLVDISSDVAEILSNVSADF
jgi:hypothetical protein